MKPNQRIALAMDLVSYILETLTAKEVAAIRSMVLFGSSARREADEDSDIDLYLETLDRAIERPARRAIDEFRASIKVSKYWKLMGEIPPIQLVVGTTEEVQALLPALLADGICLYGTYRGPKPTGEPMVLITWSQVPSHNAMTNLYRRLHGYKARGKKYPGLLERHRAQKLNRGCLLVPLESAREFEGLFRELSVRARVQNVIAC